MIDETIGCIRGSGFPQLANGASDVSFKLSLGSCSGSSNVWRFYHEGDLIYCLSLAPALVDGQVSIESFYATASGARTIDVHFDEIDRLKPDGTWVSISNASGCGSSGYRARFVAEDNVWLEKIP